MKITKIDQLNEGGFVVEGFGAYEKKEEAWAEIWEALSTHFGDWSEYDVYDIGVVGGDERHKAILYDENNVVVRHVSIAVKEESV